MLTYRTYTISMLFVLLATALFSCGDPNRPLRDDYRRDPEGYKRKWGFE